MGVRQNGYVRYGFFEMSEVLPHIGKSRHKFRLRDPDRNISVRMGGQRMLLMARHQDCVCCGLKGDHFVLEKSGCLSPHFNLYGIDAEGRPVMMTMDHITPRALGGQTEQANLQLLCRRCNSAKKSDLISLEQLRERLRTAGQPPVTTYTEDIPLQGGTDHAGICEDPCQARCGPVGREGEGVGEEDRPRQALDPVGPELCAGAGVQG